MMQKGSILVVDDNKAILSALQLLLPEYFMEIKMLSNPNTIISTIKAFQYDVVLLDMNFSAGVNSGNEGLFWLSEIKKYSPLSEVVLFTAYADIDLAVNGIKRGAFDFVVKPWENAKLVSTLLAAYELSKSKREVKQLKEIKKEFKTESEMFWGSSPQMQKIFSLVERIAKTDANILITGENGTGKDVLANEIHKKSLRSNESMVAVDIGALTDSLFESELFGHVKGSFTDAKADRAGKFEVASGGTLFLNEIGNIPLHLQAKLLTVIQNKSISRVGGNAVIPVDIRLISATNKDLDEMVKNNEFREDLLYRINTIHIALPPLRQRKDEIVPLAELFLKRYASKYNKNITSITDDAQEKLKNYSWSGNIRELQHAVEKAVILSDGEQLTAIDFLLVEKNDMPLNNKLSTSATLEDMEKEIIAQALIDHNGNVSIIAQQLGITRQTLYNKLKKYQL
ncbi:sigma-54 dependent transcriptional regulator [Bacteroidales bacterium OttesenSCG-928-K03]|nr:sigma-54 dependent transcriptional regulator [Odoribacter sp. OttesenSCG-928-L07]MDL2238813.1 sigma-54 dependent transcriptional regulator [Bacteroidales bacterium OttesenSCG-928-L14]MDL2240254.1 sigma-54 dependent transcriptional regulator [Bacteroidales bacterium OttesenSCG-928-K22]MDL2242410.1 sigma-54 dependent transcriptional regulator [Bacteroidales bacterium OttesenSCG-928-K03]